MLQIKLSTLAILLGLAVILLNIYGVLKPSAFAAAARKFPRWTPVGYVLTLLSTIWFVANVSHEPIADFASFKPALYLLFIAVGIGACLFVKDFLPVRGLAVFLLLLAQLMVETARWVETPWRLIITTWAYIWVLAGMWFTVSPWKLRDIINWATANEQRTRLLSVVRVAFGLFVVCLGLTVFRAADQKAVAEKAASAQRLPKSVHLLVQGSWERAASAVAQASKPAVSQVSKPADAPEVPTPCRLGSRRYSRLGSLRYGPSGYISFQPITYPG